MSKSERCLLVSIFRFWRAWNEMNHLWGQLSVDRLSLRKDREQIVEVSC